MGSKKVVIIGAGIAGLSLGCYLQMNGFSTEIYEANARAGGLCLDFEREGYRIDGSMKNLLGSGPAHPFYKLFSELIDMDKLEFEHPKIKTIYDFPDGSRFVEYADLDRLEETMLKIAPEDAAVIKEWIGDIRKLSKIKLPIEKPRELYGFSERMRAGKGASAALLKKWGNLRADVFSKRFKNPLIAGAAAHFETPVLIEMIHLAAMDAKSGGYPVIGSGAFARMIEDKYKSLGGKVHYLSRVERIIVENRQAGGVILEGGKNVRGDIIVSAMDGRTTLFDLLGGKFISKEIRSFYEKPALTPSRIQVSIGVNRSFEDEFAARKIFLDTPHELKDGSTHLFLEVMQSARTGGERTRTLLRIQLDTRFPSYWWMLRKAEKERYNKEKAEIGDWVAGVLSERGYPIAKHIDMIHVTTPATYIRSTGNWRGAVMAWGSGNLLADNPFEKQLPGLKNFYLAGHWVQPGGGIPFAFKSARDLAQIICREEKQAFVQK